jgi:hypothetical protein
LLPITGEIINKSFKNGVLKIEIEGWFLWQELKK